MNSLPERNKIIQCQDGVYFYFCIDATMLNCKMSLEVIFAITLIYKCVYYNVWDDRLVINVAET